MSVYKRKKLSENVICCDTPFQRIHVVLWERNEEKVEQRNIKASERQL